MTTSINDEVLGDFILVKYAQSLDKSTADLTTTDMYKFGRWTRGGKDDKKSKRCPTQKKQAIF